MSLSAWLPLAAGVVLLTAAGAALAHRATRDPAVRALIGSFRGLRARQQWRLAVRLLRDPRVPRRTRVVPLAVLLYLMMPIDIIPDFLPVIGQLDDLLIVVLGAWVIVRAVPAELIAEHRRRVVECDAAAPDSQP